jgi:hypothetical protein
MMKYIALLFAGLLVVTVTGCATHNQASNGRVQTAYTTDAAENAASPAESLSMIPAPADP